MNIEKITLHNIRSYHHQDINLPEGTTLLSGNVGAGKSTILHAIEFALFGIMKGELNGEALLRNGSDKGYVTLTFTIENKSVIITRTLKRGTGITQDTGTITINGTPQDLGATELKQHILDLLNYPKDLLKKNKNLIYRYTVYTPQEAMKHILLADSEERIDILRKVFGIDKYKKIQENTFIVISKIKEKRKTNQAKTEDLQKLEEHNQELQQELQRLQQELQQLTPQLQTTQQQLYTIKTQQQTLETSHQTLRQQEHQQQVLKTQQLLINNTIKNLQQQLQQLQGALIPISPVSSPTETQQQMTQQLQQVQQQLQQLHGEQTKHQLIIDQQQQLIQQITAINTCPTCKQNVNEEHKHTITQQGTRTISKEQEELQKLQQTLQKHEGQHKQHQHYQEQFQEQTTAYRVYQERQLERQKQQLHGEQLQQQLQEHQQQLTTLEQDISKQPLLDTNIIDQQLQIIRQQLQETQQHERQLAITHATLTTKLQDNQQEHQTLQITIKEKQNLRQKNEQLTALQTHLETIFLPLIQTIEKQTMLKVHHDFNTTFTHWFSLLMDTDIIEAHINHDYQPVIVQNSYTIDYEHLSGGEKTACALAYRLALNQVINTLMDTIKTRDLLILDEPTDGFSEEQLDRIKNVLEEVNAQQIIIVSHENKIESFVDNILHITKKEHTSEVS